MVGAQQGVDLGCLPLKPRLLGAFDHCSQSSIVDWAAGSNGGMIRTQASRQKRRAWLVVLVGLALSQGARLHHMAPQGQAAVAAPPTPTTNGTPSLVPSATSTATAVSSYTPTPENTETPTSTNTPTATDTPTCTSTASPTPSATPPRTYPPQAVRITEVAWAGTRASAYDEWIELRNPGPAAIDLSGWTLSDQGDINIALTGTIASHGYFLLERTDDSTIADISASQIYTGSLSNRGESLLLRDPSGTLIDSANASGGAWPAGNASSRASMQRLGSSDKPGNWYTFPGSGGNGHDAAGYPIQGTPRRPTSYLESTPTPTGSPSPTATTSPISYPPQSVVINELAWSGTLASASDEWIELHNPGDDAIDLAGWSLSDGNDIHLSLVGSIPSHGFFLLERMDDSTIADRAANQIYSGALSNSGETLWLRDPSGTIIDTANAGGGPWPAGDSASRASMERSGTSDLPHNWATFTGYHSTGYDAAGNPIHGTPRAINSIFLPIPAATAIPGRVVINEVLIRPHYDWDGSGVANTGDEFIELYNLGPGAVDLQGWILDDMRNRGSKPFTLPQLTISPGGFAVFFRSQTRIALNDSGDAVRLMSPSGGVIDRIRYLRVRAYNLSYGRLPDGSWNLAYGLWPTPRRPNLLFDETTPELPQDDPALPYCPDGSQPWPLFARIGRSPGMLRWLETLGFGVCHE